MMLFFRLCVIIDKNDAVFFYLQFAIKKIKSVKYMIL